MVFKKIIRIRGKPVFQSRSAQQGSPGMSRYNCPRTVCVITGGPRPLRRKCDQRSNPDLMQGMTESLEMIEEEKQWKEKGNEKCQEKQMSWFKCEVHQAVDRMEVTFVWPWYWEQLRPRALILVPDRAYLQCGLIEHFERCIFTWLCKRTGVLWLCKKKCKW